MRPFGPVLLLASLMLAVAAPSEAAKPRPASPDSAQGLRGPQVPAPAKPLQSPILRMAPTAFPSALAAAAPDGDSCRLTCSRRYYFCLAGEMAEQCSGQWIECRAGCGSADRVSPNSR